MAAPIIGASRPEQVRENAKASEMKLSPEEIAEIGTILSGSGENKPS
jgi:aryl-alcohol dehydrogenase-like predicted oxidoreductase